MALEQARDSLVRQLAAHGIRDRRVLDAVARTPRERFVPEGFQEQAYADEALPIAAGQTISQPYMVALMTQELGLTGGERVLEIGTGSGYQTAILSQLCREVVTIERLAELAEPARRVLSELGFENIDFRTSDGTLGCKERSPYDAILVTAAAPEVPAPLFNQLAMGGRLVIPVGDESQQMLQTIEKRLPRPIIRQSCPCRFVPLIGDAGWER